MSVFKKLFISKLGKIYLAVQAARNKMAVFPSLKQRNFDDICDEVMQ